MRESINRIEEALEENHCKYEMISYPEGDRKAFDILVHNVRNKKLVIRVPPDYKLSRSEMEDLKNLSKVNGVVPLYITNEADENIAVKKDTVIGVSPEGLIKILKKEKIFVYKTRGGIFVKLDNKKLRERKEELGLSLGELANILGVSRKTVYDYERGTSDVTIEVAEKLIEIFGEDILGDAVFNTTEESSQNKIDIITENKRRATDNIEDKVKNVLKSINYQVYELHLAPLDLLGVKKEKNEETRLVAITIEPKGKSSEITLKKIYEGKKVAVSLKSLFLVIVRNSSTERIISKEGFKTYITNNLSELKDELVTDS